MTSDGKAIVETDAAPDGSRAATLQDYFRWNPDTKTMRGDAALKRFKRLEADPDGRLFHICHVPLQWENGKATWKADEDDERQADLTTDIALRIAHAAQTAFREDAPWSVEGADRRAQLTGAVLRAAPRPPAQPDPGRDEEPARLHLKASRLCIHGDADFTGVHFGSGADFSQALFSGGCADFDNTQFSGGGASFEDAQFSGGDADFYNAQFSGGNATFFNAQLSGGNADFREAQFSGGNADFLKAQFSGGNANFRDAQFSGRHVNFENVQFSGGNADFRGTSFKASAHFHACVFLGALDLGRGDQPEFDAGHLTPEPEEDESGPAAAYTLRLQTPEAKAVVGAFNDFDLSGALCFGPVQFDDRHFGAAPYFTETQFFDQASFHGAKLHDGLQHREWLFKFETRAKDEFPSLDALARRVGGEEAVNALSEQLEQWRALVDAEDDGADALAAQIDAAHRNGRALRNVYERYAFLEARFEEKTAGATRFEANYRRLKELMAGIGSRTEEQRFYALELKARQARTDKDVKPGEKLFAQLYGTFSDYGQSLRRPIIWIAGIWIAFALVYGSLSLSVPAPALFATPALERAAGPLVYSAEMTLAPIANPNRHHPWAQDLAERQDWRSPAFAATRLLHRVLALPLLFLFLLTLRRRFQIS